MLEETTPRKAIEFAVQTEKLGQTFYRKLANRFEENETLKEVFELLARDEAVHERRFRQLLKRVPEDDYVSNRDERLHYLRIMSMSEFFMGEEGLYKKLKEIRDEDDALMRAFELEKATVQYYEAMKDVMDGDEILDEIIGEEKDHLKRLMRYRLTDAKFRGISDDY